jgi:hypothetical protein
MKNNQIKHIVVVPKASYIKTKYSSFMKVAIFDYVDSSKFNPKNSKWVDSEVGVAARNWKQNNFGSNGYLMDYFEWRVKNPKLFNGCLAGGSWVVGDTLVISGQFLDDPYKALITNEIPTLNKPSTMVKYGSKSVKLKK